MTCLPQAGSAPKYGMPLDRVLSSYQVPGEELPPQNWTLGGFSEKARFGEGEMVGSSMGELEIPTKHPVLV